MYSISKHNFCINRYWSWFTFFFNNVNVAGLQKTCHGRCWSFRSQLSFVLQLFALREGNQYLVVWIGFEGETVRQLVLKVSGTLCFVLFLSF